MKSTVIINLLVFVYLQSYGQSESIISGKIIDNETRQPLPFAHVIYQEKSLGTVSDQNGFFSLYLINANLSDSISITYMGYISMHTTVGECVQIDQFELDSDVIALSEVIVEAEKGKFKVGKFMKDVVAHYNENKSNNPHIDIAHYREKAKYDEEYVMFMESIGYSVFTAKKMNAAPLSNYKFFCENTKSYVENPAWLKYSGINKQKVPPAGGVNLNVFRYLEINGLLSTHHFNKYRFKVDSTYLISNRSIFAIGFNGNGDKGSIHIEENDLSIIKIIYSTDDLWSTAKHKRLNGEVAIKFNYYGDSPFISNITSYYQTDKLEHFNELKILLQKFNEFEISNEKYWGFNEYDRNPFIEYSPKEWAKYNLEIENDYDSILSDLNFTNIT